MNKLLSVRNLKTYFYDENSVVKAVDGVSFDIHKGDSLGVVGESGCGKSITALSILRLVPRPKGKIVGGEIHYYGDGEDIEITKLPTNGEKIRAIRGNEIAYIFQEPMTALNPVYTIGNQIMEVILRHQNVEKQEARRQAIDMLKMVGIAAAEKRVDEYPHEFSGGMRQRAMIAMALSCKPKLLIADEPTTALDVTIEAQILELIKDLQRELGMALMIITHDLGVIGEMAKNTVVMYTGKIVERAGTDTILTNPQHPYSQGLLNSIPTIGKKGDLSPIKGTVPNMNSLPKGCYFAPRCPHVMEICNSRDPDVFELGEKHTAKCWLYRERRVDGQ